MRTVAKVSAALLACFIASQANAYIYFAQARMLSLDWADDAGKADEMVWIIGPARLGHCKFKYRGT